MADPKPEFASTAQDEGPYDNDPDDPGGETVWGITRRDHPLSTLWLLVDELRKKPGFPGTIAGNAQIRAIAENVMLQYWNYVRGTEISSQAVAAELFDTAFNMGKESSVLYLQKTLSALNKDQRLFPDLVANGVFTQSTMDALKVVLAVPDGDWILYCALNSTQTFKYLNLKEKYIWGWLANRTFNAAKLKRFFPNKFRQ